MEAGLIASIFTCSWGILLVGATTAEPGSSAHLGGLIAIIVGAAGAVLTLGGHMIALHHDHRQ
jgi:hypothetical protein